LSVKLQIDIRLIAIAILLLFGIATAAEEAAVEPSDACPQIGRAVNRVAAAEHQQSFALDLYAKTNEGRGPNRGAIPAVEARLADMLARIADLRTTLRRVRAARGASSDPTIQECLRVGGAALGRAERVSSEVERIVIEARDYPALPRESIRLGVPAARPSAGLTSGPAPPGAAAR
jgi:hypothetical protein